MRISLPHACNRLAEVQNRIEAWNRDGRRVRDTQALHPRQLLCLQSDPLRGRMSWSTTPAAWVQRPVHRTAQGVSESDPRMSSSPAFTIARAVWSYRENTAGLGFRTRIPSRYRQRGAAQKSHARPGPLRKRDHRPGLFRFEDLGQSPCPRVEGRTFLSIMRVAVVDVRLCSGHSQRRSIQADGTLVTVTLRARSNAKHTTTAPPVTNCQRHATGDVTLNYLLSGV